MRSGLRLPLVMHALLTRIFRPEALRAVRPDLRCAIILLWTAAGAASLEGDIVPCELGAWAFGLGRFTRARRDRPVEIGLADLGDRRNAEAVHAVQMAAYEQEAALLGVQDFVPLRRSVDDLMRESARFTVARVDGSVVGAIGVDTRQEAVNIDSLVVLPEHQRRGIARRLLEHVIDEYGARAITVQTGAANTPALGLYARYGFVEIDRWRSGEEELEIVRLRRAESVRA